MVQGRKRKAYSEPREKSLKIFFYPSGCILGEVTLGGSLPSCVRAWGAGS